MNGTNAKNMVYALATPVLLGIVGTLVLLHIRGVVERIKTLETQQVTHQSLHWHGSAGTRMDAMDQRINELRQDHERLERDVYRRPDK